MTRDILRLLAEMFRAKPLPLVLHGILGVVANARVGLYPLALGGITQSLIGRDPGDAIRWSAVLIGGLALEQVYWPVRAHLDSIVMDSAIHRIHGRVLRRAASTPLVAFEDGPFFARLQRATDGLGGRLVIMFRSGYDFVQVLFMMLSVLVPVWLVDPMLVPILLVAFVPGFITQYRTARVVHEVRLKHATGDRLLQRLGATLTDRDAAAELRLFGNGPDLVRRWLETRTRRGDDTIRAEQAKTRAVVWGELGVAVGTAIVLVLLVRMLLDQRQPIGAWVTVFVSVEFLLQMVYPLASTLRGVRENSAFLGDLFAFEDEADRIIARQRRARARITAPSRNGPAVGAMRIAADRVSFAYPGSDRPVVRDVSLMLEPGERVAIVGENGAGKSTLVRLLTGLYLPDEGTVTLDGADSASEAALALRPQIGAVFQDYVPWQLTARENIGMSDLDRMGDDAALHEAADRAGILPLIDALPDGLDTWLGREFGERDLSGGQWQRVALARAFFRNSRFLVMDEPSAALDPLAEQRLFERFTALAEGRTALTISHRLGPARFADRVIVMDGGRIVECGRHGELMARNGPYAHMFRAQAAWYRDETAVES